MHNFHCVIAIVSLRASDHVEHLRMVPGSGQSRVCWSQHLTLCLSLWYSTSKPTRCPLSPGYLIWFPSVLAHHCCWVAKWCLTLTSCTVAHQAPLSSTISRSLLKFMSIKSVVLSSHLILCCPLLLLPSVFPKLQCLFQGVDSSHQVPKVLELQL